LGVLLAIAGVFICRYAKRNGMRTSMETADRLSDKHLRQSQVERYAERAERSANFSLEEEKKRVTEFIPRLQAQWQQVATFVAKVKKICLCSQLFGTPRPSLAVEVKILVSLIQVLSSLQVTFSIPFPPLYLKVTKWLSIVELDLFELMPLGCTFPGLIGFHFNLVVRTVLPLGFFVFALSLRWWLTWRRRAGNDSGGSQLAERLLSACFFILFLVFPANSRKLFIATFCTEVDGDPGYTSFLRADLSVNCAGSTHAIFANIYVPIMIVVYVVGTPLLCMRSHTSKSVNRDCRHA